MEKPNIETQTAQTILQQPMEVQVGAKTYSVAPPTAATLILASEAVARMPHTKLNPEDLAGECLSVAKDCRAVGDVVAILILGAKSINAPVKTATTRRKRRLWGLLPDRLITEEVELPNNRLAALSTELLENLSPRELNALVIRLLSRMELGDFFGLTTFLSEINLIRPTKVGTEATVSGQ